LRTTGPVDPIFPFFCACLKADGAAAARAIRARLFSLVSCVREVRVPDKPVLITKVTKCSETAWDNERATVLVFDIETADKKTLVLRITIEAAKELREKLKALPPSIGRSPRGLQKLK
jgi:hypothetical protein